MYTMLKFLKQIKGFNNNLEYNSTRIKCNCSINKNECDDLIAYVKVADGIAYNMLQHTPW